MSVAEAIRRPVSKRGINDYTRNSILNASSTELILKLYDLGLVSIERGDSEKANRVISELIAALNFEQQEASVGLFRLYQYCQDCLINGQLDEPKGILKQLRDAWAEAFELSP